MFRCSRSLTAAAVSACARVLAFDPAEASAQIRYDTVGLSSGFVPLSDHSRGPNLGPGVDFSFEITRTPEPVNNNDVALVASLRSPCNAGSPQHPAAADPR